MILATAGHVDHGKSSLTRQLTGIDPDRLAEEKKRGLTVDLGFAYQQLPSGECLGIVDVPGHERFVTNMLAGVGAIDGGILVVAADDGPMPQTQEHLDILNLLAIQRGVIAVTKIDRVDGARLEDVREEVAILTAGTFLEEAPVFTVSNTTGAGIGALRAHLADMAGQVPKRRSAGHFRQTVDRRFIIQGAGLVVTGAAFSGTAAINDHLVVSPAGIPVRVRGIRAQHRPSRSGGAGERLALNLAGNDLEKDNIRRGDWIVAPAANNPVARLDARLSVLSAEVRALKHDQTGHTHIGADDIPARIAVLDGRGIRPGGTGLVQIILERPTIAVHGDRFILRDQSGRRTIAGGKVLDPYGPPRGRARQARLEHLAALETETPEAALKALLAQDDHAVDLTWFHKCFNLTEEEQGALRDAVSCVSVGVFPRTYAFTRARWDRLRRDVHDIVAREHHNRPQTVGLPASDIQKSMAPRPTSVVLGLVLADMVKAGRLRRDGHLYADVGHNSGEAEQKDAIGEQIMDILKASGVPPANINDIAAQSGIDAKVVMGYLNRAAAKGQVRRVSPNRFFLLESVVQLAQTLEAVASDLPDGLIQIGDVRDRTGMGRGPSVELLEFFDKSGFTRRTGNARKVVRPAADVFGAK